MWKKIKNWPWVSIFAWMFVIIGFLFGYYGASIAYQTDGKFNLEHLASLGSFYQGTVASIWALAGLLFIYETLRAQKKQLQHQEAELEDQREESRKQEESRKHQDFERAFFHLLNFQNQITEQLTIQLEQRVEKRTETLLTRGRLCFVDWYKELQGGIQTTLTQEHLPHPSKLPFPLLLAVYQEFYFENQVNLSHYFRTLYHVFKFCNESGFTEKEIRRYTSLARAQLSAGELILLFYNGLSPFGEKFKPLIEKFGLLEHLDFELLFDASHKQMYAAAAYA